MKRNVRRGFSLIELMVGLAIGGIILAMGISGLTKARTSGGSRGLATAVSSEFKFAREKAIATGSPVAVIIPSQTSRSLFWLEGTTEPTVSRAVNYEGDYPRGAITVAMYDGPDFQRNATMPGFKAEVWGQRLSTWLPSHYQNDFVIVFTPNGSVITNDLPSAEGSYRVLVGMGAEVSGDSDPGGGPTYVPGNDPYYRLQAMGEPYTVAVSMGGAVESDKGLLGWSGAGGLNLNGAPDTSVRKPPHPVYDWTAKVPKILHSEITPPPEEIDGSLAHVIDKGEYLTLEIFAQSGDGKPIFADWNDIPQTKSGAEFMGAFSVPGGAAERMEFYPEYEVDGKLEQNVWRSVWTWTPPKAAEAGDRYALQVDVKDAKAEVPVQIANIPPVIVAPPGEIVFERDVPLGSGNWHLFTMWADGSRQRQLTKGNHNYTCASATADGKVIAYQRDNEVWVMNFDGTGQTRIAAGQLPCISPTGSSIAYMSPDGTRVIVKRLDSGGGGTDNTATTVTTVAGAPAPSNKLTYSPDGRRLFFTDNDSTRLSSVRLTFPGNGIGFGPVEQGESIPNDPSGSQVGGANCDRVGRYVYYHGDTNDPYIGRYPLNSSYQLQPIGGTNGPNIRVSVGQLEAFPAPSPDGNLLLFCEGTTIFACPIASFGSAGAGTQIATGRRPAWIKQRGSF